MKIKTLTISAILIAIGVIIPLFSPIKIVMEPASFTLASHVAIFISMFISPSVGISVALGTAFGFLLSAPLVVALRAFSQVIFVAIGAHILKNKPGILNHPNNNFLFLVLISTIHSLGEVIVVSLFYFSGNAVGAYYDNGFYVAVLGLVGIGTFVHSMIDYYIALFVKNRIEKAGYDKVFMQ